MENRTALPLRNTRPDSRSGPRSRIAVAFCSSSRQTTVVFSMRRVMRRVLVMSLRRMVVVTSMMRIGRTLVIFHCRHRGVWSTPVFPGDLAPMVELQRAAVRHAGLRIERPHRAPQHVRGQRHLAVLRRHVQVHARAGRQRLRPLNERASGTEVDHHDDGPAPHRGARQPVLRRHARIDPTIRYRLIHLCCPRRYCSTRTRPVTPRIRMAYCAFLPRT